MKFLTLLGAVLSLLTLTDAHTWVNSVRVTGSTCPFDAKALGYIRGYRGHKDHISSYRIEDVTASVYRENQREPNQSDDIDTGTPYPRLKAAPGSMITAEWHENGHTTADSPENNAPTYNSGKVYWYGSVNPPKDLTLEQIRKWQPGKHDNRFLGEVPYDDGLCAEEGSQGRPLGAPRWAKGGGGPCKGGFQLPEDLKDGSTYTVYWVWDFSAKAPTPASGIPRVEWYTSVMDIDIVGCGKGPEAPKPDVKPAEVKPVENKPVAPGVNKGVENNIPAPVTVYITVPAPGPTPAPAARKVRRHRVESEANGGRAHSHSTNKPDGRPRKPAGLMKKRHQSTHSGAHHKGGKRSTTSQKKMVKRRATGMARRAGMGGF